jgi:hypothetical protein
MEGVINNISSDSSFHKFGLYNFQKFDLHEVPMILVAHEDICKSIVPIDYIMSVSIIASSMVDAIYCDM